MSNEGNKKTAKLLLIGAAVLIICVLIYNSLEPSEIVINVQQPKQPVDQNKVTDLPKTNTQTSTSTVDQNKVTNLPTQPPASTPPPPAAPTPPPPPPVDHCATYLPTDIQLSDACLAQTWAKSKCTTPIRSDTAWWKARPRREVEADMTAWATMSDDEHRTACYGSDRSKWP